MKIDKDALDAAYEVAVEVMSHDVCSKDELESIIKAYELSRLGISHSNEPEEIVECNGGDTLWVTGYSVEDGKWKISGAMTFGEVQGKGLTKYEAVKSAIAHGKTLENNWLNSHV